MPVDKKNTSSWAYKQEQMGDKDALLLTLFEQNPDAIVLVSPENIITYASPAVEQIMGYLPDEIIGCDIVSHVDPDSIERVHQTLAHLYAAPEENLVLRYRWQHKNGSWHWLEVIYKNLCDNPHVCSVIGYVRDSNEYEQVQQERERLLQAEKRLALLNDVSTLLISSFDQQITLQEIAQLLVPTQADYCRIALLDDQQQIKDIAVKHSDPTKNGLVQALYDQYKDHVSSTYGLQTLIETGQAELLPFIDEPVRKSVQDNPQISTIVDELELKSYMGVPMIVRGKTIGAITFSSTQPQRHYTEDDLAFAREVAWRIAQALDNTRLFQAAQAELAERKQIEQNLRFLADASKILASSIDYQTTLTNVTQLAVPHIADWCTVDMQKERGIQQLALAHVDPQKVIWARELNRTNPPDPQSSHGLANVLRTGVSEFYSDITDELLVVSARNEAELALLRKLGLTSSMTVPLLVQGKAIGAITFIRAESSRHYSQADLSMAEELASRAALAIENARLYSEAQDAVRLRDEFIATASHELRTPLTSLKMYTQVLQKQFIKQGEESLIRSLTKMNAQIGKLAALIEDLLNVSKLEHGKLAFHKEAFDLNEVVKETVEQLQHSIRHTIRVEGEVTKRVWGDKERIGQVLMNLLTNAVKYSPKADTVVVHIMDEQGMAVVDVQDLGIGIAAEHQQHIFDRFYRVNDPEEKTYPGLGIGLHIAHEIIGRHNGTMSVVSEKGQGSVFRFTLPYARQAP